MWKVPELMLWLTDVVTWEFSTSHNDENDDDVSAPDVVTWEFSTSHNRSNLKICSVTCYVNIFEKK